MAKTFNLEIRTPESQIFNGEAIGIHINSEGGEMKVMAHHASITASFLFSAIMLEREGMTEEFFARKGVLYFDNEKNQCLILALYCEEKMIMDLSHAREYLKFIESQIAQGKDLSQFQLVYLESEKMAIEKQISSR